MADRPFDTDSPIFIFGNLKSGTTLLLSLLDEHPELFAIPVELKFFKASSLPRLSPGNGPSGATQVWSVPIPYSEQETDVSHVRERIFRNPGLKSFLDSGRLPRSIKIPRNEFDPKTFREHFWTNNTNTERETLTLLMDSFRIGRRKTPNRPFRFVEKTPHNEEFAWILREWFPNATFLHMLRNPYANVYSLTKNMTRRPDMRNNVYRHLAKSFYFMERNNRLLDNYHIVKFEDLVERTEQTMKDVSDILNIEFQQSLLNPTFWGHPWGGNSRTIDEDFEAVDPRPARAFEGNLSEFDKTVINRFFYNTLLKYGYSVRNASTLKAFLPDKLEDPISYLSNRKMLFDHFL